MKSKYALYVLMLLAYSLSMAHSVIPHHHHQTAEEAHRAHHHQDGSQHDHDHHHDSSHDENADHEGHLFFLNHDLNGDAISHKKSVSVKKPVAPKAAPSNPIIVVLPACTSTSHVSFHLPQDERIPIYRGFTARALRAPPTA